MLAFVNEMSDGGNYRPGLALTGRNEWSFNTGVGRITGVSAAETRERLLRAAATAFQTQGFEGTRVADIARTAGVSNGALYTHFGSKAALLAESLRDHGPVDLASLFLDDPDRSVVDLLVALGQGLVQRSPDHGALVVEALVAARRDPEVAATMGGHLHERDDWLTGLIREGQASGAVDPDLSAEAVARYCVMLLLGSILLPAAGLPPVDADEWATLIDRLGAALRPAGTAAPVPIAAAAATADVGIDHVPDPTMGGAP
jgi:AcrR family transcriptional regulator